jgi:hypothetical protein
MDPKDILLNPTLGATMPPDEAVKFLDTAVQIYSDLSEPVLVDLKKPEAKTLVVLGDTHGDFFTTKYAVEEFFMEPVPGMPFEHQPRADHHLLFTGDFVDRTPTHCPYGSMNNINYILALKMLYPGQVTLLRGNHESFEVIATSPLDFLDELREVYKKDSDEIINLYKRIFRELPLMLRTPTGLFAVHGGVFRQPKTLDEILDLDVSNDHILSIVTFTEPREYCKPRLGMNELYNYTRDEFSNFMDELDVNVMIRGHTPALVGSSIYSNCCLTLHTTQSYLKLLGDRATGVVTVPLDTELLSVADLSLYYQTRGNWLPAEVSSIEKDNK